MRNSKDAPALIFEWRPGWFSIQRLGIDKVSVLYRIDQPILLGIMVRALCPAEANPALSALGSNPTVEEWPEPPHQKERRSGTMICICMAANYLAVYYLKGPHKNTHPRHLLNSTHTYMPAEGRWEAPSYRPAIRHCSGAALVPP